MTEPTEQLKEKRVELILQQLEQLPTLPPVALRVLEVTGDDSSSAKQVIELISSDQSLATRILQLVHRVDAGVKGEVNSIDRAVVLLGFESVRSAVLAVATFGMFGQAGGAEGEAAAQTHFHREEFWKHSVAVACCAELLAAKSGDKVDRSEAFVCGLLHDLGKVALDAVLPKSFSRVVEAANLLRGNIADLERTVIGLDHMLVGKRLAERWQLPTGIRDAIWLHGQHPQALPNTVKNPTLINIITLADLLVRERHLGFSGNYTYPVSRTALAEAIGLSDERIEEALTHLVAQIELRATSLGLGQATSSELYQQALQQANKELGRVSGQLAAKNKKLALRAKFFDALSGFHSELRPDAPIATILQAIGQTAVAILDVRAVGAFSIAPGAAFAEVLLFDEAGDVFDTSLVDCASRPSRPLQGDGPVMAAGSEMEWLLAAISPRLTHDRRFWVCLEVDGLCIGGVVWGACEGESQRLSMQVQELSAIGNGWALALRTAQIRDEAHALAEQLADANRKLQTAQGEILRTRTMITVGEMAAGAAHEMNNPLQVISGRAQILAQSLTDPKQQAIAKLIYQQSHRASDIITELMDFAKPEPPKCVRVEVAELIQHALYEAKAHAEAADRKVEVTMTDVPHILVDKEQVRGALQEIIDNAIQATDPAKGTIDIHAAFDPYSNRVVVMVSDNGTGMDEQTLKRAFDPFFSSKRAGRRRGMGLAKAMRWVEASGGTIRLESRPGQGTRSIILLPAEPLAKRDDDENAADSRKAAQ